MKYLHVRDKVAALAVECAASPKPEAYFPAMMWLGRADLAWRLDVDRELRDAGLLVRKTGQSNRLAAMSGVLDFMVGRILAEDLQGWRHGGC